MRHEIDIKYAATGADSWSGNGKEKSRSDVCRSGRIEACRSTAMPLQVQVVGAIAERVHLRQLNRIADVAGMVRGRAAGAALILRRPTDTVCRVFLVLFREGTDRNVVVSNIAAKGGDIFIHNELLMVVLLLSTLAENFSLAKGSEKFSFLCSSNEAAKEPENDR
jgi:hypothetical protein